MVGQTFNKRMVKEGHAILGQDFPIKWALDLQLWSQPEIARTLVYSYSAMTTMKRETIAAKGELNDRASVTIFC